MKILIRNGLIIDGTGNPGFQADLLIENGRIEALGGIGEVSGAEVINAAGCWVTPGFINMHSHSDCSAAMYPGMQSTLGQGITTEFAGHCGLGVAPVPEYWIYMFPEKKAFTRVMPEPIGGINPYAFYAIPTDMMRKAFYEAYGEQLDWTSYSSFIDHLKKRGTGANLVLAAGQAHIRLAAMGLDFRRAATEKEIRIMEEALENAIAGGARGLGLGLDYQPGLYASREELLRLMKKTAELGGVVTAHTRSRSHPYYRKEVCFRDGLIEFLELGLLSGAPLHVCHIQNAFDTDSEDCRQTAENVEKTLRILDDYRAKGVQVTWDVIPKHLFGPFHYPMAASLFQPYVEQCGGVEAFSRMLSVGNYREIVETEIRNGNHASRGIFTRFDPKNNPEWGKNYKITQSENRSIIGSTLQQAAGTCDALTFLLDALASDPYLSLMPLGRRPEETPDRDAFVRQTDACIGMDTWTFSYDAQLNDPRMPLECGSPATYCGMTEFLFDRRNTEQPETTIRKLTGNPAKVLGLPDRGILRENAAADVLLIDPEKLTGEEFAADPRRAPEAIRSVFVNGAKAMCGGIPENVLNGRIL